MKRQVHFTLKKSQSQCLFALISATVVAVCVCIGVTMNLTTLYDENFDHMGIRTFCMFTVNSNIFAGITMMLCISYTVDGLRTGHYHLPNWIVDLMFTSVTAVMLTFLVSLCILAPVKGFRLIFSGSRFFLHGVCPILCIISFCCFICDHEITWLESLWALIPVFVYAALYFIMVVLIGEEKGGWNDFYGFATRVPLWVSVISILPVTFAIALLLRFLHNRCCYARRKKDIKLFQKACGTEDLRGIVEEMARVYRAKHSSGDIRVPARMIRYMIKDTGSDMTLKEGCQRYLNAFMEE